MMKNLKENMMSNNMTRKQKIETLKFSATILGALFGFAILTALSV